MSQVCMPIKLLNKQEKTPISFQVQIASKRRCFVTTFTSLNFKTTKMKNMYAILISFGMMIFSNTLFGQLNYVIYEYDTICSNLSYTWHGNNLDSTGIYCDSLTTVSGGDSIIILNLIVNQSYLMELNAHICDFDTLYWQGNQYTTSGTYPINYNSNCGCDSNYILYLIVYHEPTIDLGPDITLCVGQSITLDAGLHQKYNWSTGGDFQFETIELPNSIPTSLNVTVKVTDYNCSNSDEITINFITTTNIKAENSQQINVFPNPSSGLFNINSNQKYAYKIYDITGNKITENNASGNSEINLKNMNNGMYFLEIESESGNQSIKLIKE